MPVAPESRFRIGAVSIALTSAAVGLLVEEGRLQLDEPIQTVVPEFPEKEWPVTLRELMAHVAGVRHYRGEGDYLPTAHCGRAAEGLEKFADDPLRFQPGTRFRYSTYGWVLVSAAIEAAADEPFFACMNARIFAPLGLHDTVPDSAMPATSDPVTFYYPRFNAETRYGPQLAGEADHSCFAGAAGFRSTPSDLVRFALALEGGEFLQPATVELLQAPQRLVSGEESKVRVWREHRGLTLRALAQKAEIAPAYLSEIETRKKPGSVKAVAALARTLDVQIEALIDHED